MSEKNNESEKTGKIARNFLYMFEFVVDDLLITRQNLCAPEEYPTCTEITFRSSVYVNICDREMGSCVNPCSPKCGKCALFTLESPVTDKDKLQVHVYKKRTESCKFLIGLTEVAVKPIFDRVRESFDAENPNWEGAMMGHVAQLPKMKGPNSKGLLDNCACYEKLNERHEQWCPTSELSKRLLPLFNLCKMQTGNIVLIMRLVCNGPTIVSSFPFSRVCSRNPNCLPPCCTSCDPCPCGPCPPPPSNQEPSGNCPPPGCGAKPCPPPRDPCDPCDPNCPSAATASGGPMNKPPPKCCKSPCPQAPPLRSCQMIDPCAKRAEPVAKCLRYYACNLDKLCPTDYCEDEFDRECPTVPTKRCALSPIEQKLEKCGPCGGIPPYPRFIKERMEAEQLGKPKKDDKKDKKGKKGKDDKNGKDGNGKDANGKKKRQKGGASTVYCVGDLAGPSAVYEAECEPVCDGVLQATRKTRVTGAGAGTGMGMGMVPYTATSPRSQADYNVACDDDEDDCDGCCQCVCDCDCSPEIAPCFIAPTRPQPGPEAYDEFEACLNGSGLTIRVLKNTHKVESVEDGTRDANLGNDDDPCFRDDPNDCEPKQESCLHEMLQRSSFARNHIKRRTGGRIINHPNIPKVRANIKYSGNDACETDNYYVPFSKIKEACDLQEAKVDCYRQRLCGGADRDVPVQYPAQNQRSCCMQVERKDIMQTMKGVNLDTRRKGIEVCYKTCEETDSDVFLVKLGSKAKSQHKKNTIEIELRTPKQPVTLPVSKVTADTYVTEEMLNTGGKKKKKGKGKKGKGKGKGKAKKK